MKSKSTALIAAALGLVVLFGRDASAQTPTLTATANGAVVTIQWTTVAGATGYTLQAGTSAGASNLASVNLPASQTLVVVTAPAGTYFLRVRATAGAVAGPFSGDVVVTVGAIPPPAPCTAAPAAPQVTATPQGANVLVAWNTIAGTLGYRVEFSRTPGGAEVVQNAAATATSYTAYIGMLGTFYVRVTVGNACGQATSTTVQFTITDLTFGSGPRTPNPPPGTLLPMPGYAEAVVADVGRRYGADLAAHSGPNCKNENTWLFKLLRELRARDSRWGLNWKRGFPGSFSTDIITYNPTDGPDQTATHIYLADVIGAECEGNHPGFNWQSVTQETWKANHENPGACANSDCAAWTIIPYLAAGYPADKQ